MSAYKTLRRLAPAGFVLLAALVTSLALGLSRAVAFTGYPEGPTAVFGSPGSGTGELSAPLGLAVNEASGDVYVVDSGNLRVEKFDGEGNYLAQFDGSESPAGSFASMAAIAVDNAPDAAHGDVYVTDGAHGAVDVFDAGGKYLSQIKGTPSAFAGAPVSVAVDGAGHVWVYDEAGDVDEFSDTGGFLGQFDTGRAATPGLGLDSGGDVYLLLGCGCIGKYEPNGTQLAEWGAGTALALDHTTNEVFLDTAGGIEEFGPGGKPYGQPVQVFGAASSEGSHGVAVDDATETVYASNRENGTVAVFKHGVLPDVSAEPAEAVTRTAATLSGVVNPDGQSVTSCDFEYGTTTGYGQSAACSPTPGSGSGSGPVVVSAKVGSLTAGTAYHYRVTTRDAVGARQSADATFTTLAAVDGVSTGAATAVEGAAATLNGSLEPNGLDTHSWFEFGTTEAYGASTPHQDVGAANEAVPFAASVTELEPNTTYHYRLVAENSSGTTFGADATLTTRMPPTIREPQISAVTRVAATVTVAIDPERSATTYRVLYGETSGYGAHSPDFEAGAGLDEEIVRVGLTGLTPDTTYHYAVEATSQAGTVVGPDRTFTTAPATSPGATTAGASNVTLTSATVFGSIDPGGLPASYELDFGTDASYGTSLFGEAGAGAETVPIAIELQNLAPGTIYHYRFVAISSDGRTYGADETFTTPLYSDPIVLPSALPLIPIPAVAFPVDVSPSAGGTVVHKHTTKKKTGHRRKRHKRRPVHRAKSKRKRPRG